MAMDPLALAGAGLAIHAGLDGMGVAGDAGSAGASAVKAEKAKVLGWQNFGQRRGAK